MRNKHDIEEELDNFEYLLAKMRDEGFHYCFKNYSSFSEIKDPAFHKLRKKYLKSADELNQYIENKYNQLLNESEYNEI